MDRRRALDCLNAYCTPAGDTHHAFIHHGSPVPTQFYLFQELWNTGQDRDMLAYFYPRLKQYYKFLSGQSGSSSTGRFSSHLLKTWDYFYNSGGWDDYPPQVYAHARGLTPRNVAPTVTTAHAVRCGKILRQMALTLGFIEDAAQYQEEAERMIDALQRYSWDEGEGVLQLCAPRR